MLPFTIIVATAGLLGQSLSFDVASVKQNKSDEPSQANMPLGPGDVYYPTGGFFRASNFPLVTYVAFAYKIKGNEAQSLLSQLPDWTRTDRFDIQARVAGNPSKNDMRAMVRSLLAERFKLAIHPETREVPVFAFILTKPGKLGPQLRQHLNDAPCPTTVDSPAEQTRAATSVATIEGGFPTLCNGIFGMPPTTPGRTRIGARNVTLAFLADSLSFGSGLGRPMTDQTGVGGTVDFLLEWTPETQATAAASAEPQPDSTGPTLQEALRDQLGIKLESSKDKVAVLVLDHVEHLTEN